MISITILDREKRVNMELGQGESLMSALIRLNEGIGAYCGGRGICGKCRIKLVEGDILPSMEDKRFFSEEDLWKGYRLACTTYPNQNCTIRLCMEKEQEIEVVTEGITQNGEIAIRNSGFYGIAVDIGTTTIAMQLVEEGTNRILSTYTGLNPQRSYGADVINRIQAANNGKGSELKKLICDAMECGFHTMLSEYGCSSDKVKQVIISANTTMVHLLMGYPCENLGVSPFEPYNIKTIKTAIRKVIANSLLDCEIRVIPGISTFVGGDIVSGLQYCHLTEQEKPVLFIDLGTNGEMAVGNKDKLIVTSVAAGPAFEGGNLSCGVGSIPGAISSVTMEKGEVVKIETLRGKRPVGICGTGVIEAVAELVKEELIDETGLLEDQLFEDGVVLATRQDGRDIVLTQKDIREIQLAKSAIRSGIEVLLMRYGTCYDDIERVYLAGGFGYHMDPKKMIRIGMLPVELENKTVTVGNSSLGGAKNVLFDGFSWDHLETIAKRGEEINLATDKMFQEKYMEYLYF